MDNTDFLPGPQSQTPTTVPVPAPAPVSARLAVSLARSPADVEEAQRLRYKVFAEELGARIGDRERRLDRDDFDAACDHLIVRDLDTLRVVGTYRMLPPHRARGLGRRYSDAEFDLTRLAHLAPASVEVGRSCVHRDYRSGSTVMLLWAGLAQYMRAGGYGHLLGCASVPLADGGHMAARITLMLQERLSAPEYRVFPRLRFPHDRIEPAASAELPPLLKGYLRLGAVVCGEPAWDPDFGTADFLVWLPLASLQPRYARHFDLLAAQAAMPAAAGEATACA